MTYSYEEVEKIFSDRNCKLLQYTKTKEPVTYIASCGHENTLSSFSSFIKSSGICTKCAHSARATKYTFNDVEGIIENKGCKLLSYINVTSPVTVIASCGHEYTFSCLKAITEGLGLCRSCAMTSASTNIKYFDDIDHIFAERGCTLLKFTKAKAPITYIASCGHENTLNGLNAFVTSKYNVCSNCARGVANDRRIKDVAYIEKLCTSRGCKVVKYTAMKDPLTYISPCGHTTTISRAELLRKKKNILCDECNSKRRVTDESVKKEVEANGCTFLGVHSKNTSKISIIPRCGHGTKIVTMPSVRFGHSTLCERCSASSSKAEQGVIDFLKEHTTVLERQRVLQGRYEIDAYLPEYNFGVEFDGVYWHSESRGKDRMYHLNKTNIAKEKGITLFHIFENEWVNKREIIESILLSKLGKTDKIFARATLVQEVTTSDVKEFLQKNHRQGYVVSSINLGLYHNDILVSLMTFSKSRYGQQQYELLRFCNILNTTVVGGASKLLSFFEKNYKVSSLVSYADLRYSVGGVYTQLGFNFSHNSAPNYWYFKNRSLLLESRVKYQKHKLPKLLKNFDVTKTEYENMLANGYDRIWDCGNAVFIKEYN
jgi:hypothetical protein